MDTIAAGFPDNKAIQVAPSILAADFAYLARDIAAVEDAGADAIHVDVMDGHFVPNISIGPGVVRCLKRYARIPLDVHLMISEPLRFLDMFIDAGSDTLTVHLETCSAAELAAIGQRLRQRAVRFGISVNPGTPLRRLLSWLPRIDVVLVMCVNPGFGGQEFMPAVLPKITAVRRRFSGSIAVDGGITASTGAAAVAAGADMLVSGSYIFNAADKAAVMRGLKQCHR